MAADVLECLHAAPEPPGHGPARRAAEREVAAAALARRGFAPAIVIAAGAVGLARRGYLDAALPVSPSSG